MIIDFWFLSNPLFQSLVITLVSLLIFVPYIIKRTTKQLFKKLASSKGQKMSADIRLDESLLKDIVKDLTSPSNPIGAMLSFSPTLTNSLKQNPKKVIGFIKLIDNVGNLANLQKNLGQVSPAKPGENFDYSKYK